jgi:hypothetical protein
MLPKHPRNSPHPHSLTSLTPHTSAFLRLIALLSYHPNPTHESSAPRRGFMPKQCCAASSHRGGRCRHRGAVTGCRAADAATRARVAPPSRRPSPCPRPPSAMPTDVRPTGRADVRCPGVRCPVSRRPVSSVQASGVRVSGQTCASGVRGRCVRAVYTALDPRTSVRQDRPCSAQRVRRTAVGSASGMVSLPASGVAGGMVVRWQCVARSRVDGRPEPLLGMRTG